ncbi:MAG: UvrD-helicase domain-containing protein [Dehalococcoidia bacterium]|jgi:DNA helicase-2/ATP-dependent DNA helicase PcrA|nr:UvrD-helicase domain-containing protein [Dehalococcoidia bacterium]
MDLLASLNASQREAVQATDGPLLILAGPGSGKTRVITNRVAYLVTSRNVDPHSILAVTFTNKAANEMRDRLDQLLDGAARSLTIGTFHAVCCRILRADGQAVGLTHGFVVYDDDDQVNLIKQSLLELQLDPKTYSPRLIQSSISAAKSRLLSEQHHAEGVDSYFEEIVQRVYQRYQALLSQSDAVDFDDILLKTVRLFEGHPEVLERYRARYRHILVDEFQDTNLAQFELVRLLAAEHRNVCVVGDPDQSIYSWRSADPRNLLSFEREFPEAKVVLLEQNYRSTKTILKAAMQVISSNPLRKEMELWTENDAGKPVVLTECLNEKDEAQFVVGAIEKLIRHEGLHYGDCAVMYRINAQSRALEESLIRFGVPYRLVGGTRFYRRQEIKDIIAYLRVIHNPHDSISLARIINTPGRGIGQGTLNKLQSWATERNVSLFEALRQLVQEKDLAARAGNALSHFLGVMDALMAKGREVSPQQIIEDILVQTAYRDYLMESEDGEDRWQNVQELKNVAAEYNDLAPEEALSAFLEKVSLVADVDEMVDTSDAVTLITLHQAKGLEYPAVFIIGMEDGVLPHRKSFDDPAEMEEECRLCYVGFTRAQRYLFLSRAHRRSLFGNGLANPPSRYLARLSPDLVTTRGLWEEDEVDMSGAVYSQPLAFGVSSDEFRVGDWVFHKKFGQGVVMDCFPDKSDLVVTVAFEETGTKRMLLSLARLEKIER